MSGESEWVNKLIFAAPESSYEHSSFPEQLFHLPRMDVHNAARWEQVMEPLSDTQQLPDNTLLPPLIAPHHFKQRIPCLFLIKPNAKHLIIYCHGNGTDIGRIRGIFLRLSSMLEDTSFILVEYPGYGPDKGQTPSNNINNNSSSKSKLLLETVESVYWYVRLILGWDWRHLYVMGRSIGSAPATWLAAHRKVGGLILVSPFLSIREVVSDSLRVFGIPLGMLVSERFPNQKWISSVGCSCLFVHGAKDTLIPAEHSQRLFESCPSPRKYLHISQEMTHNEFDVLEDWVLPLSRFLEQQELSGNRESGQLRIPHHLRMSKEDVQGYEVDPREYNHDNEDDDTPVSTTCWSLARTTHPKQKHT